MLSFFGNTLSNISASVSLVSSCEVFVFSDTSTLLRSHSLDVVSRVSLLSDSFICVDSMILFLLSMSLLKYVQGKAPMVVVRMVLMSIVAPIKNRLALATTAPIASFTMLLLISVGLMSLLITHCMTFQIRIPASVKFANVLEMFRSKYSVLSRLRNSP